MSVWNRHFYFLFTLCKADETNRPILATYFANQSKKPAANRPRRAANARYTGQPNVPSAAIYPPCGDSRHFRKASVHQTELRVRHGRRVAMPWHRFDQQLLINPMTHFPDSSRQNNRWNVRASLCNAAEPCLHYPNQFNVTFCMYRTR